MKFSELLLALPTLTNKDAPIEPWDATVFLRWLCSTGMSHGELLAGRLVLGVWNSNTDWVEQAKKLGLPAPLAAKRFDLLEAAGVWDNDHLEALRAWLEHPEFP